MGDRGNIAIVEDGERNSQIWLYSHWGGSDLPTVLQQALAKFKSRWNDPSYLARNIFCAMIPDGMLKDETGFGISTRITDNEHRILALDMDRSRVFLIDETQLKDGKVPHGFQPNPKETWTFQQFAELSKLPKI